MNTEKRKELNFLKKKNENFCQWNITSESNNQNVDQLVETTKDPIIASLQDWKYANKAFEGVMALFSTDVNIEKNWSYFQIGCKSSIKEEYYSLSSARNKGKVMQKVLVTWS